MTALGDESVRRDRIISGIQQALKVDASKHDALVLARLLLKDGAEGEALKVLEGLSDEVLELDELPELLAALDALETSTESEIFQPERAECDRSQSQRAELDDFAGVGRSEVRRVADTAGGACVDL